MINWQYARQHWIQITLTAIFAGVVSYLLFHWLIKIESAASAANGLVLGIWGILLSVAGFALTLWQLEKTQSATQAATIAVGELKLRMSTYDTIVETHKAIAFIQETQRHLRSESWESAITSYGGAREAVLKVAEATSIEDSDRNALSSMLADIATISDRIDNGLIRGTVAVDRGRALRGCREHEDCLIKLSIGFQRGI